jgi:hypothetical protein
MTETETGRRLEKQQIALHALNRDAKEAGGLSTALLLKHVLDNQEDPAIVSALAQIGLPAMTYEFFTGLTAEIERQELSGNQDAVERLSTIRTDLLQMQETVQAQTRQMLGEAGETLETILSAEDMEQALAANINKVDDAFMYVLAAEADQAEEAGMQERLARLTELRELILGAIESQTPPEVQLLNQLVRAESEDEMHQLIADNLGLVTPELVTVIDALLEQTESSGQQEMSDRLSLVRSLLVAEME